MQAVSETVTLRRQQHNENEQLPTPLRIMVNIPWPLKQRIVSSQFGWRVYAGVCRRVGWDKSRLGWHTATNGPYAGIRLKAAHINHLWVPVGIYEVSISRWLVRLLTEFSWQCVGKDVWDVGANAGVISLLCVQHGIGRVISFEPAKDNLEEFKIHLEANSALASRIEIIQAAVSDVDGETEFMVSDAGSEGQILNREVQLWRNDTDKVSRTRVKTLRLDSFLDQGHRAPGILKIDIEGAEALALSGATRLLNDYHPVIVLEVHNQAASLRSISLLTQAGYTIRVIQGDRLMKVPDDPVSYGHLLAFTRNQHNLG